jgi:hypothetical protein
MKLTFTFIKWSPFPQNFKAADNSYVLATRLLQSSQSIADDAAPYDRLRALRPVRNATTKTDAVMCRRVALLRRRFF